MRVPKHALLKFILTVLLAFIVLLASSVVSEASNVIRFGESGPAVTELQKDLRAIGYVVDVDGNFGPRTLKAINHFQKANRLPTVRQAGPLTLAALEKATAMKPAVRGPQTQVTPQPKSTASGPCAEWASTLAYFSPGWDVSRMQQIMYRESRCRPNVTSNTGCCHGLLQIHQLHIPNLDVCDVNSVTDLFDPAKNICSAGVVYRRAGGMSPWNL